MDRPLIQILLDDAPLTPHVRGALKRIDAEVEVSPFADGSVEPASRPIDARLVLTHDARSVTSGKFNTLLRWVDRAPCATLVLSEAGIPEAASADDAGNGRAIGFAGNLSQDDLAGRLTAMCSLRGPMDTLRRELDVLKRRDKALRDDIRRLDDELRLAGAVQRDLVRSSMPLVDGLDIHTLYRPAQTVSGDIYDITRLDETHIAISLADVTGHGLPAALLAAFVKRALRGIETVGGQAHRLEPNEVLARLNSDILDAQLRECQFATAIHAVYDTRTRIIRWARGGAPYPILARRGQTPRQVMSGGPIVGAFPQAQFEVVELKLHPHDTLVFHTDGLDALLLNKQSGLGLCDLPRSGWFQVLGQEPGAKVLRDLEERLDAADPTAWEEDDVSAVVLQVHDPAPDEHQVSRGSRVCCAAGA